MFREAFQQRRCLLPANGFYEWRGVRKRPYWVSTGERLLFFAGIWEAYPVHGQTWLSVAQVSRRPPSSAGRCCSTRPSRIPGWLRTRRCRR